LISIDRPADANSQPAVAFEKQTRSEHDAADCLGKERKGEGGAVGVGKERKMDGWNRIYSQLTKCDLEEMTKRLVS